jgi:hypothetical protein
MQAFAEAYGANYLMPHVSWHRWLADGELSESNYPVGTGYFEQLGPAYAHTIYGETPIEMRQRLTQIGSLTSNARDDRIRKFVDLHQRFIQDHQSESVSAFARAVATHNSLVANSSASLNPQQMLLDPTLRAEFNVQALDELTSATSIR